MKKIALGLLVLTAASSAFASGSPVVQCNIPGSNKTLYMSGSERDNNTDTDYAVDLGSVDVMDTNGNFDNSLSANDKDANLGYYMSKSKLVVDANGRKTSKTVFEKVKLRLKSTEGSVIVVDGQGNGGKDGMKSTITVVLRGKDANGAEVKDVRGVSTTCSYDFE